MPTKRSLSRRLARLLAVGAETPLTRPERIVLLGFVALGVMIGIVTAALAGPSDRDSAIFELLLTACFSLFVWSPAAAVVLLLVAMVLSFRFQAELSTLTAMAVAVGCTMRTGRASLVAMLVGAFLLMTAAAEFLPLTTPHIQWSTLAVVLGVAAAAGALGYILKRNATREERLNAKIAAQARAEIDAARAERQRIADELHDVIAHDLTVISMHSRVLDHAVHPEDRQQSQQTIHDTARKALNDLRRVVDQADGTSILPESPMGTLPEALEGARKELEYAAGHRVTIDVDHAPAKLPRVIEAAMCRILRESVTNILKHAGDGPVKIAVTGTATSVRMTIRSPLDHRQRKDPLPSGGYGTLRMAARARQLRGRYTSGTDHGDWLVTVDLPTT